jgi:hypothetical protein
LVEANKKIISLEKDWSITIHDFASCEQKRMALESSNQKMRVGLEKNKQAVSNLGCDCIMQNGPCLKHEIEKAVDTALPPGDDKEKI